MLKSRTTLTVERSLLQRVKIQAARSGKGDSQVIEDALRRYFGIDLLEQLWKRNHLSEIEAMTLAIEAQHAMRS
ncbi:MAG: hypothetical protein ACREP9_20870 [Candidatus Dormibacteraceae bacterium]